MKEYNYLSFLGDVYLDKAYKIHFPINAYIFNLEFPISPRGTPAHNKILLKQDDSQIFETFGKYPVAVCLANNHIMDYGIQAFSDTIEYLEKNNIKYFGAGKGKNNFNNCIRIFQGNKTIGLSGYVCSTTNPIFGDENNTGAAKLEMNRVFDDIAFMKENYDYIIIQIHWGIERVQYPRPSDVEMAHKLIDYGADSIIGHHAHVPQSIELYKNKYIYYGLGNFIFPDLELPSYWDGKKFTKHYYMKQKYINRKSIVVNISEDLKMSYETVEFNNLNGVRKVNFRCPTWIPKTDNKYSRYLARLKRKNTMINFLKKPKIPSKGALRRFIFSQYSQYQDK